MDRIANGSIPLDEALPMAKQIAEALEVVGGGWGVRPGSNSGSYVNGVL